MNTRTVLVILGIVLVLLPATTSAALNISRPIAHATIAPISTDMYVRVLGIFGDHTTITNESAAIDWSAIFSIVGDAYTGTMGKMALIVIFAIPFLMMWITQRDMTLPGLVGLLLGLYILVMLPADMVRVAIVFIAMSITAVVYSLLKERM